jgi:hypothetical protein
VSSYTVAENMNKKKGAEMALEKADADYNGYMAGKKMELDALQAELDTPKSANQGEAN